MNIYSSIQLISGHDFRFSVRKNGQTNLQDFFSYTGTSAIGGN